MINEDPVYADGKEYIQTEQLMEVAHQIAEHFRSIDAAAREEQLANEQRAASVQKKFENLSFCTGKMVQHGDSWRFEVDVHPVVHVEDSTPLGSNHPGKVHESWAGEGSDAAIELHG